MINYNYSTFEGLFENTPDELKITVCPRHRDIFGIRWRSNRIICAAPPSWATHQWKPFKGDRGITSVQSKEINMLTNKLIAVGSWQVYF